MKSPLNVLFLLCTLGLSTQVSAQLQKGTWQLGIGAGINRSEYNVRSNSLDLAGISSTQTVSQLSKLGLQGNLTASLQCTRLLQWQIGFGVRKIETHATIRKTGRLPVLGTITSTIEQVDIDYTLLEIPTGIRLYLRPVNSAKRKFNFFLETSFALLFPLSERSKYQLWNQGKPEAQQKISLSKFGLQGGGGVVMDDRYLLALNWHHLKPGLPEKLGVWSLSFSCLFTIKNSGPD
jgi:hypothetical protein